MDEQQELHLEAIRQLRLQIEALKRFLETYEQIDSGESPVDWDDDRALLMISGSALSDDPPDGWGKAKLAQFARGRVYGEQILAGNALEFTEFMLDILDRPEKWTREAIAARWGVSVEQMYGKSKS